MTSDGGDRIPVRVEVTVGSVVLFLAAIAGALAAAEVLVSARRIVSWAVASAVVAAMIELVVRTLEPIIRRSLAIVLTLLAIAGLSGLLVFGVSQDLDREVRRLQDLAPVAALRIEQSERFGEVATEAQLQHRVRQAVNRLREPSSGLAGEAVSSIGTYIVCAILTVLFLSWGPKVSRGALAQLPPAKAERVKAVAESAFNRARRYVLLALGQSLAVGLIGYLACRYFDLPAPAPLALALAAMTLLPKIGILFGALPILLLSGGLGSPRQTVILAVLFLGLQLLSTFVVQHRIVRTSHLYIGPAIVAIAFLAGFELYGFGGAMYAAALFVFAVAAIDANAELVDDEPSESERMAGI